MSIRTHLSTILFFTSTALVGCAADAPPSGPGGTTPGGGDMNGGGGNGGGGGTTTATASQVLSKFGMVECDDAFACKASFPADAGVTFDQAFGASAAACYADAATYYNATAVEASITANKITFDATAAGACVAGFSGTAAPVCTSYWTNGPAFPDACGDVFTGKVADGATCTNDLECAGAASVCLDTTKKCGAEPAARRAPGESGLAMHPKLQLHSL